MSRCIEHNLIYLQDLSVVIKADSPIKTTDIDDDPLAMHRIHKSAFIDEQEFYVYKCIESTFPHLRKSPGEPPAHKPSIRVAASIARRPYYFIWNTFLISVSAGV